jgi:hypothetical protein
VRDRILPLIRVTAHADGRLTPRPLAPWETNEAWWTAALNDWRNRPLKAPPGSQAIGWFPGLTWNVTYDECELRTTFTTEDAVNLFGHDYLLHNLAHDSVVCPKSRDHRICRAKLKSV